MSINIEDFWKNSNHMRIVEESLFHAYCGFHTPLHNRCYNDAMFILVEKQSGQRMFLCGNHYAQFAMKIEKLV